jgi:ATP-binding cassette subfamily F protein 3
LEETEPDAGRVILGTGVRLGYFDQLLSCLENDALVVDAIRPEHKEFVEQQRRDLLARFGIYGDMVFQNVRSLSGGERNRVALAMLAASDANLLVLDEPTNHLDLWAREALEKSVRKFDGTVLFVSHDRYFLNRVADHLLIVEPNRFRVIQGNYETYLHLAKQGLAAEERWTVQATEDPPAQRRKGQAPRPPRRKRRFGYRKSEEIEAEIAERESCIEQLHAALADPQVLRDGNRVKQVKAELEAQQAALPALYEHWEEAAEMNG